MEAKVKTETSRRPSAFASASAIFERVYANHKGPEPDAFAAAILAVEPMMGAVKEELGAWLKVSAGQ